MNYKRPDKMRLNAFLLGAGQHLAAWRHPMSGANAAFSPAHYKRMAQVAEAGKFDAVFFGDGLGLPPDKPEKRAQSSIQFSLEPLTLLAYLAATTEHIGLIATVSSSYLEPFHLARKFASLDLLSNGRAGWNLVTSSSDYEAQNFNREYQTPHGERYTMAREYVQVVKGLWDSFEDDAFISDTERAQFFDPAGMHELNHRGTYYQVKGPLSIRRPVQGYPVIVQAGSSEDGRELAAATAELVFTAQPTIENAVAFYSDLKKRLPEHGRRENDLLVMPGVFPVIAATEKEAKEKYEELQERIPEAALINLMKFYGIDYYRFHPDDPFPALPATQGQQSRQQLISELAARERLSIAQVARRIAGARGHWTVFGTPASIADQLEDWFMRYAADGFNIMPSVLPGALEDFVQLVIPELQRRGLFRKVYEGRTLRENLGLERPAHPKGRLPITKKTFNLQ